MQKNNLSASSIVMPWFTNQAPYPFSNPASSCSAFSTMCSLSTGNFNRKNGSFCAGNNSLCSGAEVFGSGNNGLCTGAEVFCVGNNGLCTRAELLCVGNNGLCTRVEVFCLGNNGLCTGYIGLCFPRNNKLPKAELLIISIFSQTCKTCRYPAELFLPTICWPRAEIEFLCPPHGAMAFIHFPDLT